MALQRAAHVRASTLPGQASDTPAVPARQEQWPRRRRAVPCRTTTTSSSSASKTCAGVLTATLAAGWPGARATDRPPAPARSCERSGRSSTSRSPLTRRRKVGVPKNSLPIVLARARRRPESSCRECGLHAPRAAWACGYACALAVHMHHHHPVPAPLPSPPMSASRSRRPDTPPPGPLPPRPPRAPPRRSQDPERPANPDGAPVADQRQPRAKDRLEDGVRQDDHRDRERVREGDAARHRPPATAATTVAAVPVGAVPVSACARK